jgi:SAM-dependent methyltransferase/uncharacterized RDD family membrane protein YckC
LLLVASKGCPRPCDAALKQGGRVQQPPPAAPEPAPGAPAPGAPEPAPEPAPGAPAPGGQGGNWGQQGTTPDWAAKAQEWRPAAVAAGPAAGISYAELGMRVGAYIIDLIILFIVGFIVNVILATILFASLFTVGTGIFVILGLVVLAINVVLAGVYFVYTWTTMKASPGQRMLGMMTVSEADGAALTQNAAITRYLYMFAPGYIGALASNVVGGIIGLLLSLVGLGWTIYLIYTTANDPKRQGYHDKMAHSVVVKPGSRRESRRERLCEVEGRLIMSRDWDAATYDRVAHPQARWGAAVIDRLPLRGDERVLDAGCGSGRVTELLAERLPGGTIVALDGSPAMIEQARLRLARYDARIEYLIADLGRPIPLAAPVDAVISTATFHWVPDHDALFRNLAAVLVRGGRLVAQCGGAGNVASVMRVLASIGDGWLGDVVFATPEATARPPRGRRLLRARLLADRGTDDIRGRRAVRNIPPDRDSRGASRASAGGRARCLRPDCRRPPGRAEDRLCPAQHRGAAAGLTPVRHSVGSSAACAETGRPRRPIASGTPRRDPG